MVAFDPDGGSGRFGFRAAPGTHFAVGLSTGTAQSTTRAALSESHPDGTEAQVAGRPSRRADREDFGAGAP